MKFLSQLPRPVYFIFVFVFLLVVWRILNIDLYDSNKGRDSIHGDGYTDKFTHSAAMYFHDYGFAKTKGLPVLDYKGDFNTEGTGVYTRATASEF